MMFALPDRLTLKLIIGIGCALLLALLVHDRNRWKAKSERAVELVAAERAAHASTVANYRAAAEKAWREDIANAARARAEQAAINERIEDEFETRIAAARAAALRLRLNAPATAPSGSGGSAPVPGLSDATQGAAATAEKNRLSQSERLIATEQAIQLDALIKWVKQQAEVEMSAD